MTTVTPSRPTARAGRAGFAHLLRAEWTKFRTVRGWVISVIVAMLLTILLGLFISHGDHTVPCSTGPNSSCTYAALPAGPGGESVTDTYYFVQRSLTRGGSITAEVTSLTEVNESSQTLHGQPTSTQPATVPWSKAGLIITAGPSQGSAYAAVMVTGSYGTRMQWNYTGDTPGLEGSVSAASPRWLRLTRAGDVITGYDSADGTSWAKIGTVTLPRRGSGNSVYPATALTEVRVIAGTAALVAVFAVFAVAVGAIVRHGAGSVAAVIAAIVLPYLLTAGIAVLPAGAADWVLRVTPAAGFAIRQAIPAYPQVAASYTPFSDYFPLAPWAGFAVTCAWAALALALAAYLLRRRDA
jgi:hypothetical protein